MRYVEEILKAYPAAQQAHLDAILDCLKACTECAQNCTACADACLSEEDVQALRVCIRLNQDCADICETTARLLSRQTGSNWDLLDSLLRTCAAACQACGTECEQHGETHEHCRICAEACRRCEAACDVLIESGMPV